MPDDAALIGGPIDPAAGNRGAATDCFYVVYRGGPAGSGLDYAVVDRSGRAVCGPLDMADARAEAKRLNAPALNS